MIAIDSLFSELEAHTPGWSLIYLMPGVYSMTHATLGTYEAGSVYRAIEKAWQSVIGNYYLKGE
jgi:hypothetical protein